jgi:hypothetical protein
MGRLLIPVIPMILSTFYSGADSKGTTINRSGGRSPYYRERIALRSNPFDLANSFQNARLISTASTAACHY